MKNNYPLYDKRFVYFDGDRSLIGKLGFFADNIDDLAERVNEGDAGYLKLVGDIDELDSFPIIDEDEAPWRFFYYDPFYSFKAAYADGTSIDYQTDDGIWHPLMRIIEKVEDWPEHAVNYRYTNLVREKVKETGKRFLHKDSDGEALDGWMTNRALSEWLSSGEGEMLWKDKVYNHYEYLQGIEDYPVPDTIYIRKFDDDSWHQPIKDYVGDWL